MKVITILVIVHTNNTFMLCYFIEDLFLYIEEEGEHNWVFSVDQMVGEVAGTGTYFTVYSLYILFFFTISWISFSQYYFPCFVLEHEESEWISQNSSHSIGYSNGDHDLAHNVLQVCLLICVWIDFLNQPQTILHWWCTTIWLVY